MLPSDDTIENDDDFIEENPDSPFIPAKPTPDGLDYLDPRQALDFFTNLLGENTFFVPIVPGSKKPITAYAKRPLESTKREAYKALFARSGIAVYMGARSDNLIAIDFDILGSFDEFVKDNPELADTLTVKSSRGAHLWFRMEGDYPKSCRLEAQQVEWRADKNLTMLFGQHESGWVYEHPVLKEPKVIRFEDINWPDGWQIPGEASALDNLISTMGPVWLKTKSGVKLNHGLICRLYSIEKAVIFDNNVNRFYGYRKKTGCWEVMHDQEIERALGDYAGDKIREIMNENPDYADLRDELLVGVGSANAIIGMRRILKGEVARDAFARRQRFIHAANCIIDLEQRPFAIKEFSQSWYSRNRCGVEYVAGAECPRFINELLAPQLGENDRFLLQLWVGQAILGVNATQSILLMMGEGGTGKGVIAKVVEQLIGRQNMHELRTKHLTGRFEMGFYYDKTLLFGPDVDNEFMNNEGAHSLKALTGGDQLTGEIKGKSMAHSLHGSFNVLLQSNSRLRLKMGGDQGAWRRRLLVLLFNKPGPVKRIVDFDKVLIREEGPGILNWAIEGARLLLANIDADGKFPLDEEQKARVESMIQESDSVRSFIANYVKRSPLPTDVITSDALFKAYTAFCDEKAWDCRNRGTFMKMTKDLMVELHRSVWSRNIRVRTLNDLWETTDGFAGVNLVDEKQ